MENKKIYRYLIVIALVLFMLLQVTNVSAAENEELQYYNFSVQWNAGYYYGMDNTCSVNCYIQCPQGFYPYIVQGSSAFIAFYDLKGNSYYTLCSGEFNRNGNLAIFDNTSNQNGITTFTINNAQNNVVGTFEMIYEKSYTGKKGLSYETDKCIYKNIPVLINGYTTSNLEYNSYLFDNTIGALQANKYLSPVIIEVSKTFGTHTYIFELEKTEIAPTEILCNAVIHFISLDGQLHEVIINKSNSIYTPHNSMLYAVDYEKANGYVSFDTTMASGYLKENGYSVGTIDSVDLLIKYDYDGIESNISAYNYNFTSGILTGITYNPVDGNVTQLPLDTGIQDNITTDLGTKDTLGNITEFITDTLSSVVVNISAVFSALISLLSSSTAFIKYLGTIYQAIFGTTFGLIIQGALLMSIALRFFGR